MSELHPYQQRKDLEVITSSIVAVGHEVRFTPQTGDRAFQIMVPGDNRDDPRYVNAIINPLRGCFTDNSLDEAWHCLNEVLGNRGEYVLEKNPDRYQLTQGHLQPNDVLVIHLPDGTRYSAEEGLEKRAISGASRASGLTHRGHGISLILKMCLLYRKEEGGEREFYAWKLDALNSLKGLPYHPL